MIRPYVLAAALACGSLAGCAAPQADVAATDRPAAADLAGTAWQLVRFQPADAAAAPLVPPAAERYTLLFEAGGTLAMQLDCNRASGRWEAAPSSSSSSSAGGGAMTITAGPMTRAMCQPGAIDTRFVADAAKVRSYTLAGGRLSLVLAADGGSYVWEPLTRQR